MPETIIKYLNETKTQELITEIKNRLATKAAHYTSMPLASADYSGQIVQYIGTTNASYTNGDWYRCDYDELADPQAQWVKVSYNKEEINSLISSAGHFEIVSELPTTAIKTNVIYLVPKKKSLSGYVQTVGASEYFYVLIGTSEEHTYEMYTNGVYTTTITDSSQIAQIDQGIDEDTIVAGTREVQARDLNNVKTEYINLDGTTAGWEKIGETTIDLSDYVKFENLVPITTAELEAMWGNV